MHVSDFKNIARKVFKDHGLEDEKLELVIADLFDSFEDYLLRNRDLVRFVKESIDREEETKRRFR